MSETFYSVSDVRRANERLGHHWFEPSTMRFFRSRVGETVYGGRYFVSSEQGPHQDRRYYSIREAMPNGAVETVEFQAYDSREQAIRAIQRLLREGEQDASATG